MIKKCYEIIEQYYDSLCQVIDLKDMQFQTQCLQYACIHADKTFNMADFKMSCNITLDPMCEVHDGSEL